MPYRSPVHDILFSLSAVADLPGLLSQGRMGDLDWEAVTSIITEARALRHGGDRAAQSDPATSTARLMKTAW